jgi:hypothetical protein
LELSNPRIELGMFLWILCAERGEKEVMSTTDTHTNIEAKIDEQL